MHLGSADPVVWRSVARGPLFSAPFLFVGTEELRVGEATHRVRDFLAFTPGYKRELLDTLDAVCEGDAVPAAVHQTVELHEAKRLARRVLHRLRDEGRGQRHHGCGLLR